MIVSSPTVPTLVDELLDILAQELGLLELQRAELADMSQSVLQRDNPRLEQSLAELERVVVLQQQLDDRLCDQQARLAEALGRPPAQARLSHLARLLPVDQGRPLLQRRAELLSAVAKLRRQHLETSLLILECGRVNKAILEALIGRGSGVCTYGPGGKDDWRPGGGVMNTTM